MIDSYSNRWLSMGSKIMARAIHKQNGPMARVGFFDKPGVKSIGANSNCSVKGQLHPEESLLLIQVIEEQPFNQNKRYPHNYQIIRIANQLEQPFKKTCIGIAPFNKMPRDINEDGVHADDLKEKRPFFVAQHITVVI